MAVVNVSVANMVSFVSQIFKQQVLLFDFFSFLR